MHIRFGAFELDEDNARLTRSGVRLDLPPKAFAVLCALASQPGRLIHKSDLLDRVWGHHHVSESVLKTIISELRAALGDDPKQAQYIETVPRRGYRFVAPVHSGQGQNSSSNINLDSNVDAILNPNNNTSYLSGLNTAPMMVGHNNALSLLSQAWHKATDGNRQLFWIAGEAGVGKTTLIDTFVAKTGATPVGATIGSIKDATTFARGQCIEQHGAGEPYLPILEALASLCRNDPSLAELIRAYAPTWLLQLPWLANEELRDSLRRELAGVGQERMLREFGELLEQYTRDKPLLLITEDLHWSDYATIHLLNHIARRRQPARLLWLASFRLAEIIADDKPLKSIRNELKLHRLCEEVVLEPFSEQELALYIERRFPGTAFTEPFVQAIHQRTDGLPLFVVNVLDDLTSRNELQFDLQSSKTLKNLELAIPESLAGVMEKQITHLSGDDIHLLEVASVCGTEIKTSVVAKVITKENAEVANQFDHLAKRTQWLSGPTIHHLPGGELDIRYSFRHAMYRAIFYQRMGELKRIQLHGQIAQSLLQHRTVDDSISAAELANHCEKSHQFLDALQHYCDAAENALRHFAPQEALELTESAINLLTHCGESDLRYGLELGLYALRGIAMAQSLGSSALQTKQSFHHANELLDRFPQHPLHALVGNGYGLSLFVRAEYSDLRSLTTSYLSLSQTHNDEIYALIAYNLLGQMCAMQGKNRESIEWFEKGIASSEKIGAAIYDAFLVDPLVNMRCAMSMPLMMLGHINRAREQFQLAATGAKRLGQPMAQMVIHWFGSLIAVRLENPDEVDDHANRLHKIVSGAALAQGVGPSQWYRGWALAFRGAPREGFREIDAGLKHNMSLGMMAGAAEVRCYAAEVLTLAEDYSAAKLCLDEAMHLSETLGENTYQPQMWLLYARLATIDGDKVGANEFLHKALLSARTTNSLWAEMLVLLAMCEQTPIHNETVNALIKARQQFTQGEGMLLVKRVDEVLQRLANVVV